MVFPDLSFFEQDFSPPSAAASGMLVTAIVNSGSIMRNTKNFSLPFMYGIAQK